MIGEGARQREETESLVFSGKTCTPALSLYKWIFNLSAQDVWFSHA
ncbi:hypothetical protein [Nitrosomonas sp.]|nr:hypothetical protein [Nitrosomonas sp.]